MVDKVANLTINNKVGDNLIDKVTNLALNKVGKDLIEKVANLTINDVRNDSNRENASDTRDVQVQFEGDSARFYHQNVLSGRTIGIRHEEVPVLVTPMEPSIIANNQPARNVSTGVVQAPQAFKMPVMQEFVVVTTPCNTGENRTRWIVSRTGFDGSTPDSSGRVTSNVSRCLSPSPPSVFKCVEALEIYGIPLPQTS